MGHHNHFETLLARKDEEIASLQGRLQAYVGRLSVMQTRLLSALDTMDVMQSKHNQEFSAWKQHRDRLQAQLDHYVKVVKTVDLEREDMRDAILSLVEKIETSDDYSNWSRARIHLSNLSEPYASTYRSPSDEGDLIMYASALIESLRRARDQERSAHDQTSHNAESRILALEAKLSRREAELESCIASADHGIPTPETTPRARFPDDDVITSDRIISTLDSTVARNKVLESEISALFKRLEEARATSSSMHPSGNAAKTVPGKMEVETTGNTRLNSELPAITEAAKSGMSSRASSAPSPSGNRDPAGGPTRHFEGALEQQIRALGDKVDAFALERQILLQTIPIEIPNEAKEQAGPNVRSREDFFETECLRLRQSEIHLRDELEATKADARAREDELLEQIKLLQLVAATPSETRAENVPDLLGPDDGEMPMELATPLLPLNHIADVNGSNSSSPHPMFSVSAQGSLEASPSVDASSIPLPPSPESDESDHENSLTVSLSHIGLGVGERAPHYRATSSFVAELRQVENQLAATAVQLQAGERALNRVEHLVHELHPE